MSRLDPACTEDLVLAACEAASNAILHANGTSIRVTWAEQGDGICIEVRDDGVFLRRVRRPDDIGGRGVPLMVALMDEVGIREGTPADPGTEVRLIKRCEPATERSKDGDGAEAEGRFSADPRRSL